METLAFCLPVPVLDPLAGQGDRGCHMPSFPNYRGSVFCTPYSLLSLPCVFPLFFLPTHGYLENKEIGVCQTEVPPWLSS